MATRVSQYWVNRIKQLHAEGHDYQVIREICQKEGYKNGSQDQFTKPGVGTVLSICGIKLRPNSSSEVVTRADKPYVRGPYKPRVSKKERLLAEDERFLKSIVDSNINTDDKLALLKRFLK